MKIAIIGGGWVGCHLSFKYKDKHNITLFEKNKELFSETSYKNQNRLHYGFHYPRNFKTRELCKNTYDTFIKNYSFIVDDVRKNFYCIPKNDSLIDFDTYKEIFKNYDFTETYHNFDNIEGCILTKEKFINYKKAKEFFNKELKDIISFKEVTIEELRDFDLIINATNNTLNSIDNTFFELTISLIYEKIKDTYFDSITLMDGLLFSLYPYDNVNNLFTLTDVEYTPIKKFNNINDLNDFKKNINDSFVLDIKEKMEKKVLMYLKDFNTNFVYKDYYLSMKSKTINKTDDRYPVIEKNNNIINCFTGKIQGIYVIEEYLDKLLT